MHRILSFRIKNAGASQERTSLARMRTPEIRPTFCVPIAMKHPIQRVFDLQSLFDSHRGGLPDTLGSAGFTSPIRSQYAATTLAVVTADTNHVSIPTTI